MHERTDSHDDRNTSFRTRTEDKVKMHTQLIVKRQKKQASTLNASEPAFCITALLYKPTAKRAKY